LPASVTYQGEKYPLKVSKVVPEVKDRQFEVELVFVGEQPDNVRIGKSYRVQVELGQPETAIVIPRGDFFQTTGGQWIYKMNRSGDRAVRVPITIGRQNPTRYEVLSGLDPGDKVVVSGYANFGDVEELLIK
jgi:multidrug efflux pump subunit AcrA (membrane-fusion protein)